MSDKRGIGTGVIVLIVVSAVIISILAVALLMPTAPTPSSGNGGGGDSGGTSTSLCSTPCPDDLDWAGTINVENPLNDTGTETYDTTMYFFNTDGSLKTSITDTTAGSATLQCGEYYDVEILSTLGASGDTGEVTKVPSSCTLNSDGSAKCLACGSGQTWTFEANQHGLPEVRVWDAVLSGWMFDNQDASATDYETTDGVVFKNVSGASADCGAIGSGGELHIKEYVRANIVDEDVNDLGMYVLVDARVATWDTPTVLINGETAQDASTELNSDESVAYSDYEYVYKIPASKIIKKNKEISVDLSIFALGGQDPDGDDNVSIDYAPIGRFASNKETNLVNVGAIDDSTSRGDVHTRFDTEICMS